MTNTTPDTPVRHSELFRFVKVRNPRAKTHVPPTHTDIGVITYDAALAAPDSLYAKLLKISGDASKSAEAYLELEASFKASKSYAASQGQVAKMFPIALIQDVKSMSFKNTGELKTFLSKQPAVQTSKKADSFKETYSRAWDNLFVHGLSLTPDIGIGMHLCDVIRSLELVRLAGKLPDKAAWNPALLDNLAKSPIIIPTEIIPIGVLNDLPQFNSGDNANLAKVENERQAAYDKINTLKNSKDFLHLWAEDCRQASAANRPAALPKLAELRTDVPNEPDDDSPKVASTQAKESLAAQHKLDALENEAANNSAGTIYLSRKILHQLRETHPDGAPFIPIISGFLKTDADYDVNYIIESIGDKIRALNNEVLASGIEKTTKTILVGKSVLELEFKTPTPEQTPSQTRHEKKALCKIKTLGVGDLLRVEQKLICYQPGEIAHIENIFAGEEKARTVRRLKRSEETTTEEYEKIVDEEKDLQSTDRMEMESESEKIVSQNYALDSGLNVSGPYGVVDFEASLGFSMALSTTEANRNATKFAKEVVEKTRRTVSERIRTTKTVTIIEEFEETNVHNIVNATPQHQVGIYRWVDKFYKARLVNYGKRAFIEFTIPEPAAYHIYCKAEASNPDLILDKPIHPSDLVVAAHGVAGIKSHEEISEANYAMLCAFYNAQGVAPLPAYKVLSTEALSIPDKGMQKFDAIYYASTKEVIVPAGYTAVGFWINVNHGNSPQKIPVYHSYHKNMGANNDDKLFIDYQDGKMFVVQLENHSKNTTGSTYYTIAPATVSATGATGGIPDRVTFTAKAVLPVLITAKVEAIRKKETYEKWQIETYKAIMDAYNRQLSDYNDALRQLKNDLVFIQGDNPGINRQTEIRELKRGCTEQLLNVRKANNWFCFKYWGQFGAIKEETFACGKEAQMYPAIDFCEAINQGKDVMFFEQAIEWRHMNYVFYPYYWGRKCRWKMLYNLEDTDPLFTKFLQCGMARVVVPIRPGFEAAVMNYLETGLVWNGQGTPIIGDPLFVDISTEIAEALDYDLGLIDDTDPRVISIWEYKLPTNLVLLQESAKTIPESELPCKQAPLID
jgi:hypothetical protein